MQVGGNEKNKEKIQNSFLFELIITIRKEKILNWA
jgi:hypothetical protein